jgi:uncharacterized membrane protein YjjP (DUF1212 family)
MPEDSSTQHAVVDPRVSEVARLCQPEALVCCEDSVPPPHAQGDARAHAAPTARRAALQGLPQPREHEAEAMALALWMGQLLMDNGAESERVAQTVSSCAERLGCPLLGVLVTYEALVVRAVNPRHAAELRKVRPVAVNMSLIEELSHLSHQVARGELGRAELRRELTTLEHTPRHYPPWLTCAAVALACAAFSRLFGGDWGAFVITFVGSGAAMAARHYSAKLRPNRLLFAAMSAAVAAFSVCMLQQRLALSHTEGAALTASVLMLVPGVPAINAVQDMIKGHLSVAVARACEVVVIVVSAALGLALGVGLGGVSL